MLKGGISIILFVVLFFSLILGLVSASNGAQKIDPPLGTVISILNDNEIIILSGLLDPNMEWKLRVLIKREVVGTEIVERPVPRSSPGEAVTKENVIINITRPIVPQSEVETLLENKGIPYEKIEYYPPPDGLVVSEVILSDGTITKSQLYELAEISWVSSINAIPAKPVYVSKNNYFPTFKRSWALIIGGLMGALMICIAIYAFRRKKESEEL